MMRSLRIGHQRHVLAPGINTIGRDPASMIVLNDPSVSRRHATVVIDGETSTLTDLDSRNGTTVMHRVVAEPTVLNDGDEIEFGDVKGWFIVETSDDPPTTTHRL
jgi:pSer/pThr/pTyr-binding forkhead associated (FHA) protein